MFLKAQCGPLSSGAFINKCIKMLSAQICTHIVSLKGEHGEHYEDVHSKNWSTSINNSKAARSLEHVVCLREPAGQYKRLGEEGGRKGRTLFAFCESTNTPKNKRSRSKTG